MHSLNMQAISQMLLLKVDADFKYAGFVSAVNLKGASFTGATDFKYTTLDDHQTNESGLVNK